MSRYELILPKMGESVEEATVTNWLKNVGDRVEAEEAVVEVATDKVDSEIPSPVSGILREIVVKKDGIAKVGNIMAIIEVQGTSDKLSQTLTKPESNNESKTNDNNEKTDYEVTLPKMGESVEEATVTNWLKNIGDRVEAEEVIVEIATDKVDSEVSSPVSGVLKEIVVKKDEIIKVGHKIAIIEIQGGKPSQNSIEPKLNNDNEEMDYKVILPKMGESVNEATVTNWLKNIGDRVETEEAIVEIATDKVDSEVPSPVSGILKEIIVKKDEIAKVDRPIAIISTRDIVQKSAHVDNHVESSLIQHENIIKTDSDIHKNNNRDKVELTRFYSPLVKSIAKRENISDRDLEKIVGTGRDGRVTKQDILKYVDNGNVGAIASNKEIIGTISNDYIQPAPVIIEGNSEVMEMSRMRKIIADHMIMSKRVSPHVTSCIEVDVTNVVKWRLNVKDEYLKKYNQKITFTPIFLQAIVEAIKEYPLINVSVDGNKIIKHSNINIGMATALPSGDLIVPVIKNADRQNLLGLTSSVNDLANRARANKLNPDDIKGATYTMTNIGGFGNTIATPIINQPQVAIMAIGAIIKKPAVIETPEGDMIAIRHKMYLSHSYDHRVVDGALGGMFVKKVSDFLEKWNLNTAI